MARPDPNPTIRGRGAAHDPPNRFDPIAVEREGWARAEDPAPETTFYRDASRSIIARNDSPDVGFEASVNPYRGCECGCAYCMAPDTPILMADGTSSPLGDLRVGDAIYGTVANGWYRVLKKTHVIAHWETKKPAYRIILEDGTELIASADHRFLTPRGWKYVAARTGQKMRRWHLTTKDHLIGIGPMPRSPVHTPEYMKGYLCGMIRGDGHLASYRYEREGRAHGNQYQFRLVLMDEDALSRTRSFLSEFGIATHRFTFSEKSEKRAKLSGIRTHSRDNVERIVRIVEWPADRTTNWSHGFLAGVFDAEGSYGRSRFVISNTDPVIIREVKMALGRLGFESTLGIERRDPYRPLSLIYVVGGLSEHLRFFQTTNPAIQRKKALWGNSFSSTARSQVVWIEKIGPIRLFDITTGTEDFIANGYVSHNCYARPFHEHFGLSAGLDFETKIFVKEDAPELLREELSSPGWEPTPLVMSGVTDPYQPVESRLGITRRCLEVLVEFRNPVGIVTKRHTVVRDADLLGELARHDAAIVNLSITTLDRELQRVMEPRAAIPEKRLDAIRTLSEAGIPTGVMVAPVVPGLTDHEMPSILEAAAGAGAVRAGYIVLRLPHGVKELFADWLERHLPDRREKVLNRLRSLRGGRLYDAEYGTRMRGEGPFAEQIRSMFEVGCRRAGLNPEPVKLSTAAFRRPGEGRQLGLFGEEP